MKWYRTILIPTDGSDNTRPAIEQGLEIAKLLNADVTVVSVMDVGDMASVSQGFMSPYYHAYQQEAADAAVEQVVAMAKEKGVRVMTEVRRGNPALDIIEMSKRFDLIVMGTKGRTGLPHLLLGSVAEKVVRYAKCPVLVVRSKPVSK